MALRALPKIERLDLSVVNLPDWHPEASRQATSDVYGYVIDHPDGVIVFDTGVGFGNEFIDEVYAPRSERLEAALAKAGFDATSVVAVVNSHLHFDHCGQNPLFFGTDVRYFMQGSEVAEVARDRFYTDAEWALPPVAQRNVLDGDLELADGVTILATPGHTPGHQSVVVEAADERVVLAGQVVWDVEEFVQEEATSSNVFSVEYRDDAVDSIRRIKALRPGAVYFAHCRAHRAPDADGGEVSRVDQSD